MLTSYTLHTDEADVPQVAVDEIAAQLQSLSLCQNTVGIVVCHYDFVENGVVASLQAALPFPLVGITSFYQKTPAVGGLFELTITVLTSDQLSFSLGVSTGDDGPQGPEEKIQGAYRRALEASAAPPSLILSFISANRPISGDGFVRQVDLASGGVPNFGIVNSGEDDSGANIYVICGDSAFSDGLAMLLVSGPLEADMRIGQSVEERLLAMSTTVTLADGVFVKQLNGQPAVSYLKTHSIALDDTQAGSPSSIPFYCRMPGENTLVGRTLKTVHPDGVLEFMAEIPEGSLLRVGTLSTDDILAESREVVDQVVQDNPRARLLLIGSCVGRFITLGLDTTAELDYAMAAVPDGLNYLACYAGGEICPVGQSDRPINRYHNNSFAILALS